LAGRENLDNPLQADPHDQIVRLEQRIEKFDATIESCRKFILASRTAIAGGAVVLGAMLVGAIRFDPGVMAAAVAAFLGALSYRVQTAAPRRKRRRS
jgi:hypothetical protein